MKKRILAVVAVLFIGYFLAVLCHLFLVRNITSKEEVYAKYCSGYITSCQCETDNYGIHETGFPFISGRDDFMPCGVAATTEQRALNNYSRNNAVAFTANILFWSGVITVIKGVYSVIRNRRS